MQRLWGTSGVSRATASSSCPWTRRWCWWPCDLSGRDYLGWSVDLPAQRVGDFDTELGKEFFLAFVRACPMSLHIRQMAGENTHHILEAVFKGAGRALKMAVAPDEKHRDEIPSTKGVL